MKEDFFTYSKQSIAQARAEGHHNVAHNREAALRCLAQYWGKERLPFDEMSSHLMAQFKDWLTDNGRKESTARLYIKQIRTMYNAAAKEGLAREQSLLNGVKSAIPVQHTRPILPEEELRRMRYADLSDSKSMSFARDMFLFSIYARGINFTEIAHIKKSDVKGFSLTYTSLTTPPSRITVPWDAAMQEIADRYPSTTDYLFPFLTSDNSFEASRDIKRVRENVINALKKIAIRCHLSVTPSLYMSREIYLRTLDKVSISSFI